MIVAVVDDLLFSSKIRAAADRAGQSITFVRRRDAVLAEVRALRPSLVIIDLDRAALDPIAVIADIKAQPDLAHVKVLGFVSHVQTATIQAARSAGADVVLARSAFVATLPAIIGNTGYLGNVEGV